MSFYTNDISILLSPLFRYSCTIHDLDLGVTGFSACCDSSRGKCTVDFIAESWAIVFVSPYSIPSRSALLRLIFWLFSTWGFLKFSEGQILVQNSHCFFSSLQTRAWKIPLEFTSNFDLNWNSTTIWVQLKVSWRVLDWSHGFIFVASAFCRLWHQCSVSRWMSLLTNKQVMSLNAQFFVDSTKSQKKRFVDHEKATTTNDHARIEMYYLHSTNAWSADNAPHEVLEEPQNRSKGSTSLFLFMYWKV